MESVTSQNEALLESDAKELPVCQHYWMIEKPEGPVSKGMCRLCGEKREFQNYIESTKWQSRSDDVSLEQLAGGSRLPAGIDVRGSREDSEIDEDG